MTRGFITIATGKEQYYIIAANLVKSYRLFSKNPLPFAIIAEEHNKYTALFDDVVITTEATRSFMDKFLLMKLCPYDETIFIDADSLAYGDLNEYWQIFENATDFSASGVNVPLHQKENVWYNVEDIGEYGKNLQYKVRVHSGVCFIRKSETLKKLYADSMELCHNYHKLYFHSYAVSKDECVMGVAMPMNNMKAVRLNDNMCAAYPCLTKLKTNMLNGKLSYKTPWNVNSDNGIHLHFGTIQTYQPLYRFDAECVNYMLTYKNSPAPFVQKLKYKYRLRKLFLVVGYYPKAFALRLKNKLIKLLKKKG